MKRLAVDILVLVCIGSMLGVAQDDHSTSSLQFLASTERAFARVCAEKGIRASFLQFFADSAVAFFPEPAKYKAAIKNRPIPANPLAMSLEWEPQVGGVAASGDLGFTTGPSIFIDNTAEGNPKYYGQFFSVWKKEKDGTWKVVVDIGIETPTPASPLGQPCTEIPEESGREESDALSGEKRDAILVKLESEFGKACKSEGTAQAYLGRTDSYTRLHREKLLPVVGVDAIKRYLANELRVASWSPMGGDVSAAGDIGYSYGSYELAPSHNSDPDEKGYYLHVWKCNKRGEWKLVVDVAKPEPPAEQK
ncbi:MAG TPA: hypothetical protein DGH68_11660 [Bacteroidetes bacterium]|nr:hypothetical protein [Bacteroidota bacterium]